MAERPDPISGLSPAKRALLHQMLLRRQGAGPREEPIPPRPDRSAPAPLSFAQRRLWFLNQMEEGASAYHLPLALRLVGDLDVEALGGALGEVVRRHEALRTVFPVVDGEPVQRVLPAPGIVLPVVDCGGMAEEALRERVLEETASRFALESELPFRFRLFRRGAREHVLLLVVHHIVSDGWSMGVLMRDLGALYAAQLRGEAAPLPELRVQYADFAVWQHEHLGGGELERQLGYWTERLADAPPVLELPGDRPRPSVQGSRGGMHTAPLPAELTAAVDELARREGATPFMVLLAAFGVLLARYSDQEDLVVGTPVAGRSRPELEELVGCFLNTLALRLDLSGEPTFRSLLARVRGTALDAYGHQELPFEKLVEALKVERSLAHSPVFQVMFSFQNAPRSAAELPGLAMEPVQFGIPGAAFDLALSMAERGGVLVGEWEYGAELFDPSTVERMAAHFRTLLEAGVRDPDASIRDLPLLSDAEVARMLELGCGPVVELDA